MNCPSCNTDQDYKTATFKSGKLYRFVCGHTHKESELCPKKDLIADSLMPFQKTGVKFGQDANYRYLCADDMRLGKTVQVLNILKQDWEHLAPCLIVVKARTKHTWLKEALYWLSQAKGTEKWGRQYLYDLDSNKIPQILDTTSTPIKGFNLFICSMDSFSKVSKRLLELNINIKTLIVDESHNFKNMGAQRTKALHDFSTEQGIRNIICLSGTPINNNALEYFPTLHLLRPDLFPNYKLFVREWIHLTSPGKGGLKKYKAAEFFELTKSFIIRRLKSEVLKEQPSFTRIPEIVEITDPEFIQVYTDRKKELQDFLNEAESRGKNVINLLSLLSKLRETCGIAKIPFVIDAVEEFFENEETVPKLLIGVHHHAVGNVLKLALNARGIKTEYLIGGLDNRAQQKMEHDFEHDPECKVLIASTLAAGEGLDFQFVHTVFQVERQWNVYKEKQFEDRINGMKQKYAMTAVYFMVKNSIDEWMHDLISKKMQWTESALDAEFFESENAGGDEPSVGIWELAAMAARVTN